MNKKILLLMGLIILLALAAGLVFIIKGHGSGSVASVSASSLVSRAKEEYLNGNLPEAKSLYSQLVNDLPESSEAMNWQKRIEDINIRLLFSNAVIPGSVLYEIKPGDTLTKIAREFNTTTDLIMKSNNLTGGKIIPARKIRVWKTPFTILVDKSQNILILKSNEEVVKTYIVSTGKNNSTPVGEFKIVNKLVDPTWYKAGTVVPAGTPENILGTRWMGIDVPGYGIHGTTDPQNLGKQVTQGCVRMNNSDVEELYVIIPVGTEVTIVD